MFEGSWPSAVGREPGVREGRLAAGQGAQAHAEEAGARGAVAHL